MNRIAITGANSMIGSALVKLLANNNIEVIAIVRPNSQSKDNLSDVYKKQYITKVECDINNLLSLRGLHKDCSAFYHFAWSGTVAYSRNDCYLQNQNIQHTLDAVNLSHSWGCKRFIGAGSQAEYGRTEGVLSPDTPANPENAYGIAKYAAGKFSKIEAEKLGMEHIWTRILSVYGENDNENTMIISTIKKLLKGETPSLTKAEQLWDYLHQDDAALAFYLLGDRGIPGSVYCIGSGDERELREYIQIIRDIIDKDVPLGFGDIPYSRNQAMRICANIESLTKDTGFKARITFEEGIKRTIEKYKKNLQNIC